jgi:hypothetical protein
MIENKSVIISEDKQFHFEHGPVPQALEIFRNSLPWPFARNETNIFIAAFYNDYDLVMPERIHTGVDFHVKSGTEVCCIEDGQIIYGIDDERGWTFGDLFIQGSKSNIRYRYCHLDLKSLPWDIQTFWAEKAIKPKVKAGQIIGKVASWFSEVPSNINLPQDLEALYGRKRDHLHLETSHSPYTFFDRKGFDYRPVMLNPLLVLQKPEVYFKK